MAYGDIEITPGAGAPVAADLIAGVGFQRVKLVDGAEGGEDGIGGSASAGLKVQVTSLGSSGTSTLTNVSDQATNIQLLASNSSRRGMSIHNDSAAVLYVNMGATASATAYTVKIPADAFFNMDLPIYTGAINGIWSADTTSGQARITEYT